MNTQTNSAAPTVGSSALFSLDSVICGDNCEVMRQWPDECIDLVVTSPPYDDLREYGKHEWDFYGVAWNLARLLKPGGVIVWNVNDAMKDGSETGTSMRQALHFQSIGLNIHDTMIWRKGGLPQNGPRYEPNFEYMFVVSKGAVKTFNPLKDRKTIGGKATGGQRQKDGSIKPLHGAGKPYAEYATRFNVWDVPNHNQPGLHPAVFPERLAKDHVASWSNPGEIVLDPFAGSGSTLKAAKELNRRYVGIEVNPEYVKICEERTMQESLPLYCENNY